MKKIVRALGIIASLFLVIPLALAQDRAGISFQENLSWSAILAKANAENKHIFVDVYTTWCGPCKMMDRDVYADRGVGQAIDSNFISIKVQMDTTVADNEAIKSFRSDAEKIKNEAKITAYPTLLFYSPDGELIYKVIGYRDAITFTKEAKFALDPSRKDFRRQLANYQQGVKDYPRMGELAIMTKQLGDKTLAFKIAKDYTENYLDKQDTAEILKKDNLIFINNNGGSRLISPTSKFFYIAYHEPQKFDSIFGKGYASLYVNDIISQNLIKLMLYNGEQIITKKPNWQQIIKAVANNYPDVDATALVLNNKIEFYRGIENWDLYTTFKTEQIKKNPLKLDGMNVFFSLNFPAWDVFEKSTDKKALEKALEWINLGLSLENNVQYLDTKANLLYKLGRTEEAISLQEKASERDHIEAQKAGREYNNPDIPQNLDKMKRGQKTWP